MSTDPFTQRILTWLRYTHALMKGAFVLLLAIIGINSFFLTLFRVDGHSMDPTLHPGQVLPVNMKAYSFQPPQIGDIVVITYAGSRNIRFVKRIAHVPGDTVTNNLHQLTLGPDEYYVLGDNSTHSTDSRVFGPIKKEQIVGKVVLLPNRWDFWNLW